MDLHQKITDINKRWAILDDESYENKLAKFKTRILNFFSDIDQHVSESSISLFCYAMGIEEIWEKYPYISHKWSHNLIKALTNESDPKRFFRLLEIIFTLDINTAYGHNSHIEYSRDELIRKTQQALEFSNIGVNMVIKNNDVIFYPGGEKLLDEGIINNVLSFLSGKVLEHFLDALKSYEQNTPKSRVKSAESLRRTLEEFLKQKLANKKGLKENISELGKKLKSLKANNDIKNLATTLLTILDNPFFNNNSKHEDGNIDESENEFLIYQIALLMRYVEKILK